MIVTLAIFFGCNQIGSIINPIIGSWETTIIGVTASATFDANGSASETNSLGELGVTRNGTWDDDPVDNYSYSFNSDKSEMTLENTEGVISITYSRQ